MPVRKVADIKIRASSNGRTIVTGSGTKFYSYDKNSAAIDFHFFDQDGSPTDLLNSEVKLMLLTKESDIWKKFTIFDNDLEIQSRIKGRARYIIPDTLRGYQGVVQGYVYLNFADGSRTDECYFSFTIERSKIEEEFENAGGYFIKEIQEVFDEVKEDLKNMRPRMETEIKDLQDGLDKIGTNIVDANAKIKDIQANVEKYRGPQGADGQTAVNLILNSTWNKGAVDWLTSPSGGISETSIANKLLPAEADKPTSAILATSHSSTGRHYVYQDILVAGAIDFALTFDARIFNVSDTSKRLFSIRALGADDVGLGDSYVTLGQLSGLVNETWTRLKFSYTLPVGTVKVRVHLNTAYGLTTPPTRIDFREVMAVFGKEASLPDIWIPNVNDLEGPIGGTGATGLPGINASGQLVFNNRFDRWSLDLSPDENLALAGWTKPAYFQVIDPEPDKPVNRIASMQPRTSTTQFWSTGIAVVPGTYVKWRGQVRSNEVVTNSTAIFAASRFFGADVPDVTNSAAASQLDGTNETSVYLRANGTVTASKPAAVNVISSKGVTFDEANKWYDFEAVIEVPAGAAWLKLSAYAGPTGSATQVFSYRDFTAVAYQKGDSAYQVWLNDGNIGTESDFINSLKVGYTKAESDEKYATKASVLPTATDAEAITGTATNKLITPKNLQTFYEDRQKISVARFGLSDLDSTSVDKFTEASWRYRRTGSQVDFFGRFNFKVAGDSFSTIHTLPIGFRLSADFDDTSWNVPLSAAKFSSLSTYQTAGFAERMQTNFLKVASSTTGNVYFYGRWYTDDPFPANG